MSPRNHSEEDLTVWQAKVRGRQGKHLPLHGANDEPVPNETGNTVRSPQMARNKAMAPVSLRGKSVDALDGAGRGEAYSSEAGRATKLRTKESERRTNAGARPAPAPITQQFFIPGPLPGLNDILRKHHMVYSLLKSQWGLTIARCIIMAKIKRMGYCRIEFVWREANNRRDDDNITFAKKFVLDALRDTKIIQDDRRRFVHSTTDCVVLDPDRAGVDVTLIPVCVEVCP